MSYKNFIICILSVLLLAGCASRTRSSELSMSAQEYLQLAATTQGSVRNDYLLLAASRYLEMHQTKAASHILTALQQAQLNPQQAIQWRLLQAKTILLNGKAQSAINFLQVLQTQPPQDKQQQLLLATTLAHAYASIGNVAASLQQRQQILNLSADKDTQQQVISDTWIYLQS